MDFASGSLNEAELIGFFNKFKAIPTGTRDIKDIASDFLKQIYEHFSKLRLKSNFYFDVSTEHVNIITGDLFWEEHRPKTFTISKNKFYRDFGKLKRVLDDPTKFSVPYRHQGASPRNVWLAPSDELDKQIDDHGGDPASAINDINGLGLTDSSQAWNGYRALIIKVTFPANFSGICYKPTFVDGPIGLCNPSAYSMVYDADAELDNNFFLNSKKIDPGYGRTKSTMLGKFEVMESITAALDSLTRDFKFEFLGYAARNVNRDNFKASAKIRYREISTWK